MIGFGCFTNIAVDGLNAAAAVRCLTVDLLQTTANMTETAAHPGALVV